MITISKSELKANILRVFREIEASGEDLIVTDRNRPVLRIQPITRKRTVEDVFGSVRGELIFYEDTNVPTVDEWPEA